MENATETSYNAPPVITAVPTVNLLPTVNTPVVLVFRSGLRATPSTPASAIPTPPVHATSTVASPTAHALPSHSSQGSAGAVIRLSLDGSVLPDCIVSPDRTSAGNRGMAEVTVHSVGMTTVSAGVVSMFRSGF